MLGGGTFTLQNKTLPGTYINFVSAANASNSLSDRGVATMPLELDWGPSGVFEVSQEDFQKNSMKLFGYAYTADAMKGLRDLFLNIQTLYAYRLNAGGVKAAAALATAKYAGIRGNALKYVVEVNVDDATAYDVTLYLGDVKVDTQTVKAATDLVDDDYVTWIKTGSIAVTAGTTLTGGTNATVSGTEYQAYLDAIEGYAYNAMGVVVTDDTTKKLFAAFVKRMRDSVGVKFQLVLYSDAADYEGVINVKNTVSDSGASAAALVYWVTGAEAGCAVNKSLTNKKYDGEYTVTAAYTQSQLEAAIKAGEFAFHNVSGDIRVLEDINSLVTTSTDKNELFQDNKVIRVIDQIGTDIAVLFNKRYLGLIPNDAAGRISLWNDIVDIHNQLQTIRAIQDFTSEDITVSQGTAKNAVVVADAVSITGTMEKLYMTVTIA